MPQSGVHGRLRCTSAFTAYAAPYVSPTRRPKVFRHAPRAELGGLQRQDSPASNATTVSAVAQLATSAARRSPAVGSEEVARSSATGCAAACAASVERMIENRTDRMTALRQAYLIAIGATMNERSQGRGG